MILAEEYLCGTLEGVPSDTIANARLSRYWPEGTTETTGIRSIQFDLDKLINIAVPAAYRTAPIRDFR